MLSLSVAWYLRCSVAPVIFRSAARHAVRPGLGKDKKKSNEGRDGEGSARGSPGLSPLAEAGQAGDQCHTAAGQPEGSGYGLFAGGDRKSDGEGKRVAVGGDTG